MPARVVVLGAGFGGLEITTRLSESLGDNVDVVLIDKAEGFVFGFSKLDVMFGRVTAAHVLHRYADIVKPGVTFVRAEVESLDPQSRRVETSAGAFDADYVVVALGADLDPAATPGLLEAGHEFYTTAGAFATRDILAAFAGGRVVVGVTSTPFKCPPAPSETALLVHDHLVERGLREESSVSLIMPFGVPIPPSPEASAALLAAFEERGIAWLPDRTVVGLDPDHRLALCSDGSEVAFDLFLGVPRHVAPRAVVESGMTVDGWVAVDPHTLETAWPNVFAVGDVTSVGTPKAGVFSEGQGAVVAERLIALISHASPAATYDGHGICYVEFGRGNVAKVDVTFRAGERPHGSLEGPATGLLQDKVDFGATRIAQWFGREWSPIG